jgi:hypothetical protein
MNLGEVPPVIDVHPPSEPIHGWRDFFIHLSTITIGLLIALSLEGCVEWQHHRHLVHEAEASLHTEIQQNSRDLHESIDLLHKQQQALVQDVAILRYIIENKKVPPDRQIDITFNIRSLSNVSWKTAQSTGALSYIPYDDARDYADIYNTQDELEVAEQQAARDAIVSVAPFINSSKDDLDPTGGEAPSVKQKIEVLQGQLILVNSFLDTLDGQYKKFLASHPH